MNPKPETLPRDVFIYRNLHKTSPQGGPIYSIRDVATGLVCGHTETITLTNATFVVGEKGRDRVRREKRKNVHAGVRGTPTAETPPGGYSHAYYNPHKVDTFIDTETGQPIHSAPLVTIGAGGVQYLPEHTPG